MVLPENVNLGFYAVAYILAAMDVNVRPRLVLG